MLTIRYIIKKHAYAKRRKKGLVNKLETQLNIFCTASANKQASKKTEFKINIQ